jgi:hypothetical protein
MAHTIEYDDPSRSAYAFELGQIEVSLQDRIIMIVDAK